MRVAFLHPDLGLGGAERLVVDACVALVERGHAVDMFTSHYDPGRAFDETRAGGFPVRVFGDWLPRHVREKGHILFAHLRALWLSLRVGLRCGGYDVVFCDQISTYVPVVRLLAPRTRILFYCHHPDLLLVQPGGGCAKRLYRVPFDLLEQFTTAQADRVVVNSEYTRGVYERTFTLARRPAQVLYPCVRLDELVRIGHRVAPNAINDQGRRIVLLSINRFERKKAIGLAVNALVRLRALLDDEATYARVRLVLAGGYDERVAENREYFQEVSAVVRDGGVEDKVVYKRSFSDAEKIELLAGCTAVVYTPENEHFGIVPIEAMAAARPVLATRSGGPMESVSDGETGFLAAPHDADAFAEAMRRLVVGVGAGGKTEQMGRAGRERVTRMFSRDGFGEQLERHCQEIVREGTALGVWASVLLPLVLALAVVWVAASGAAAAAAAPRLSLSLSQ